MMMLARLLRALGDKNSRGAVAVLFIVGIGAVLAFAMLSLAARVLGPVEFGYFAGWFNVFSFVAVVAVLGQETFIARTWAEHFGNNRFALAHGAARFGLRNMTVGVAAALVVIVTSGFVFKLEPAIVACGCAFVACVATQSFVYQLTRAIVGNLVTDSLFESISRILVIAGLAWLAFAFGSATAVDTLWLMAAGCLATTVMMAAVAYVKVPRETWRSAPQYEEAVWRKRSSRMWFAAILEACSQYLDVIVISLLLGPLEAGAYFVATRIANVFAKVTHSVNTQAAAKVSFLFYRRELGELDRLIRGMSVVSLVVIGLGLPLVLLLGKLLLPIFGEIYTNEFPTLVVLAIGTAAVALAGPAPLVLLHTGHEGFYSQAVLGGLVARVVLFAALAPAFGTLGVAIGSSAASIATAVFLNLACRKRVGFDPSVVILLRAPLPSGSTAV